MKSYFALLANKPVIETDLPKPRHYSEEQVGSLNGREVNSMRAILLLCAKEDPATKTNALAQDRF